MNLTIATRGSRLALWQAEYIRSRILASCPDVREVSLLVLKTRGDVILDTPLAKIGGKGLFVKEIEEALLDGRADIAVHSMKDVPMELPEGLVLGAIPEREDPRDALLSAHWPDIASLPQDAVVGTSSLRRAAQLAAIRPDLVIRSLRGNVDTRLRKLLDGEFAAIVMAMAGIRRLALEAPHVSPLAVDSFVPASGQGALGIEYRSDRQDLSHLLAFLDHPATRICVTAERALLAGLEGGCQTPIGAHATMLDHDRFRLDAVLMDCEGKSAVRQQIEGTADQASEAGARLAGSILQSGGEALMRDLISREAH